jgi:hypothetical protein
MIVRCIDNTLQADVLAEGREYEVRAERDEYYYLNQAGPSMKSTRILKNNGNSALYRSIG